MKDIGWWMLDDRCLMVDDVGCWMIDVVWWIIDAVFGLPELHKSYILVPCS